MTARPALWAAGLAGSAALHGVLLAMLWLAVRPEPVTDQPMPQTEIDVQALRLERTEAASQAVRGEPARTTEATGSELAAGAIPQTRADPLAPPADIVGQSAPRPNRIAPDRTRAEAARPLPQIARPLAATSPAAQSAARVRPQSASLTAAGFRPPPALAAAQPVAAVLVTATAAPAPVAALAPVPESAALAAPPSVPAAVAVPDPVELAVAEPQVTPTAAALPEPSGVSSAIPKATPTAATAPQTVALGDAEPAAQPAPAAPTEARKVKAALAFSGGEGDIDPVSLAAFQSFMRPGDVQASGDALRDGVAGMLAQVPCSRLQVGFDPATATLQVNGHIPEDDLRAPVLAALRAQMGADIAVSDNILILPRPQCGALSGIAGVGLPQSTDQITNPLLIGREAHARVFSFAEGELLSLDMTAPDYPAFVYLDYFDAAGNVLHLEPNEFAPLRRADARAIQRIGARTMQDTGLKLVIAPPYGQEIAVAFAASEPLYDGLRRLSEPAAPYLDWLKDRVAAARDRSPDFKGEWVYFFVTTAAN